MTQNEWKRVIFTNLCTFIFEQAEDTTSKSTRPSFFSSIVGELLYLVYHTRYRAILPPDREWGNPQENGSVTGMIGVIARREADIAVDSITITGAL